jgi:hypothetical protein
MDDITHSDAPVFLLPESSFHSLQELRSQMFLMASTIFAATVEEEKIPLHIPRSLLAQCFQLFATQLTDALDASQRVILANHSMPRTH